ncbi:hypothetical protein [Pseudomonas sp. TE3610]
MSIVTLLKFLGILDEKDTYMKAKGGPHSLRLVGQSMLKVDIEEIYASESYQQAQAMTDRIIKKHG